MTNTNSGGQISIGTFRCFRKASERLLQMATRPPDRSLTLVGYAVQVVVMPQMNLRFSLGRLLPRIFVLGIKFASLAKSPSFLMLQETAQLLQVSPESAAFFGSVSKAATAKEPRLVTSKRGAEVLFGAGCESFNSQF